MDPTIRLQHENIFLHYMSLIEKPECNDGSGEICNIILINKIDIALDIFSLDNGHIKTMYKILPNKETRIKFTISQRYSVKFLQYYNVKKCRTSGFFPLESQQIVTRNEFEMFHISCDPFNYLLQPTSGVPNPLSTFSAHDSIKDCTRGVKRDASIFPKIKDEKME